MTSQGKSSRVPLSYRALRLWARSAISVVYRDVSNTDEARLPVDRPVILAANHGNALGDVAVMIAATPDFPHFLAAASWWKSAPARVLFRLGGVLPIHRRREGEDTQQNTSAFAACNEALASGAHIAIFPEGEMHLESSLLPLKTGAARIALGAAADAGIVDVVVVPVGLVYEDRGRFRSKVELHFGEPIAVAEWVDRYRADPASAVRDVTDLLAGRLAAVTVNHPTADEARVVDRAAALALADEPGPDDGRRFARRNALRRDLAASIASTGVAGIDFRSLADALAEHEADLRLLGVEPEVAAALAEPSGRVTADARLRALALPAAFGLVANAPMLAGVWFASRRVRHETWQATTKGVVGTFLGPVVWATEAVLLSRRLGRGRALALTAAGASAGIATLTWWDRFDDRRGRPRPGTGADHDRALDDARASRQKVCELVGLLAARVPAPVTDPG